ncbi:hypothetical protein GCM10025881_35510 [Pseudolysinimonas kribbensis]|uniref:Luciferase-like domain-containing protein n=1 Tax=Pseudolysinimonas kribbensis TaxID=433641 RepID=A0ABQ6K9X0_9MICO|nr:hypothetical protein GCM10025881_35510 [Pseudolysinimonas kribbensis]
MPDYGHPLRFGTFLTPTNAAPEQPVALAQLSESLGYDLATFQDHPYQPAFLDTWTLISWVLAETETIHVSGNVLNGQMRQPAMLARSAASLDLLSHGRFELGLGAGASPTPSPPWVCRCAPRARPCRHSTRRSTSSAASGTSPSADRCASRGVPPRGRRQARAGTRP